MIKAIKRFILNALKKFFHAFGYSILISPNVSQSYSPNDGKIRINVGSGDWSCDGWTNLDYPTKWYAGSQSHHKFIPYDIRSQNLPFKNESVDLIYSSHVIEHIENEHIENFFKECYRVLKHGGGGRLCCPDAEFLYNATKAHREYWTWRDSWFSNPHYCKDNTNLKEVDKLVAEIATPKFQAYKGAIKSSFDYTNNFNTYDMNSFFNQLTNDLTFRLNWPGDHINWWTYEKMKKMLQKAGFKVVFRSKFGGSIFQEMKDICKFDTTQPQMSLYVEFIK